MSETFQCGPHVTKQIRRLLGDDPGRLSPRSRAWLAALRSAAAQESGTAPDIWAITSEGIPEGLGEVRYARLERAVHVAMTQFAIHQQSRSMAMHDPRVPFGRAVRRLAQAGSGDADLHETPVYRRFTSMALSTTMPALVAHARGLVTQLRSHDIAFDYGRFADDLYWFQVPGQAGGVQRRWGRDFHHLTRDEAVQTSPTGALTEQPTTEGDH